MEKKKNNQKRNQNLRVEQSKGSSREITTTTKKNFRKTKPWHIFQLVANDCYSFCIE